MILQHTTLDKTLAWCLELLLQLQYHCSFVEKKGLIQNLRKIWRLTYMDVPTALQMLQLHAATILLKAWILIGCLPTFSTNTSSVLQHTDEVKVSRRGAVRQPIPEGFDPAYCNKCPRSTVSTGAGPAPPPVCSQLKLRHPRERRGLLKVGL